jgi:hypothetical protein
MQVERIMDGVLLKRFETPDGNREWGMRPYYRA